MGWRGQDILWCRSRMLQDIVKPTAVKPYVTQESTPLVIIFWSLKNLSPGVLSWNRCAILCHPCDKVHVDRARNQGV